MNKNPNRVPEMSKPSVYRIEVKGHLPSTWSDRLEGMQITESQTADGADKTTLVGRLSDQAALSGVLNTLYELHVAVVSVTCLDSKD